MTQKIISGKNNHQSQKGKDEEIIKGLTRRLIRGGTQDQKPPNLAMSGSGSMGTTMYNQVPGENSKFFDKELPHNQNDNDDFYRDARFDQSNALGWSDDKLGKLAEINKTQLETALRDMNNFARTDAGFHR